MLHPEIYPKKREKDNSGLCKTTVVHYKRTKKDEKVVYIGRGSFWGNPFAINKDGDREEVINKYRHYIFDKMHNDSGLIDKIMTQLEGKRLACWCAPKHCHGDVLVDIIRGERWIRENCEGGRS